MSDSVTCTLLILTYKGQPHLKDLLPTIREAIAYAKDIRIEVVIIDNAQSEGTRLFVETNYPEFSYFPSPKNDFLFSYNAIVAEVESEFVFLLNDDLKLDKKIFSETLPLMESDPSLFAVSCTLFNWDGTDKQEEVRTITFKNGWLNHINKYNSDEKIRYTFNACGGAAVYRTKMFNELFGFDRKLFYPAYYEDTDLSHRAWHRGWKIINNPAARVFHKGSGSWNENNKNKKVDVLRERNKMIGMLKNCDSKWFAFLFISLFPVRFLKAVFYKYSHPLSYISLIPKLPILLFKKNAGKNMLNDERIVAILGSEYQNC